MPEMKPRTKAPKGGQLDDELGGELATYEKVGLFQQSVGKKTTYRYRGVLLRYQRALDESSWIEYQQDTICSKCGSHYVKVTDYRCVPLPATEINGGYVFDIFPAWMSPAGPSPRREYCAECGSREFARLDENS